MGPSALALPSLAFGGRLTRNQKTGWTDGRTEGRPRVLILPAEPPAPFRLRGRPRLLQPCAAAALLLEAPRMTAGWMAAAPGAHWAPRSFAKSCPSDPNLGMGAAPEAAAITVRM